MDIIKDIDNKAYQLREKILNSISIAPPASADVYYVSETGNDNNDGRTPETAWKSLEKVSSYFDKNNKIPTYVCFKRGDTFRGQLLTASNVTYTSYGEGAKPLISGSPENGAGAEKWKLTDEKNNIWCYYKELLEVGSIFFNGGESYAVKACPDIVEGKYAFGAQQLENLQFLSAIPEESAITLNNNTAASLRGKIYLRCDAGNPGEIYDSIEFAERLYTVFLSYDRENIVIDNIAVKFGGAHGIGGGFIKNLTVQNCEIGFIGGGIQSYSKSADSDKYSACRYGNGVEIHSYCDGYTVKNCWVHDIYDAGITHQQGSNHSIGLLFKDVTYASNLIENCIYSIEYFARKSSKNDATVLMDDVKIKDNIMRKAGCGFGMQRTLLHSGWNMGSHIMGWFSSYNLTRGNFVVENNIFDRVLFSSPDRPLKQNTSIILVTAGCERWLPKFSGNTYICENGNQFAYYGLNVGPGQKGIPFVLAEEHINSNEIFGDETGRVYIL